MSNTRPTRVLIDRAAFAHNLQCARALIGTAKVMAVIKADGYGHGMEVAAHALIQADEFAVNGLDDAHRLRDAGISKPLNLLCAPLSTEQLNSLSGQHIRPTLFDLSQLTIFEQIAPASALSIWLKVDMGMGRLGISPEQLGEVLARLTKVQGIADISVMTHLANADDVNHVSNNQQLSLFTKLSYQYDFAEKSVLNSAGVIALSAASNDVVRPGIMLYGISPMLGGVAADHNLKPVMTFQSELISVKRLKAGSAIGYGSTYTLDQDTQVGVVACGYGDGYPRHAPSGTPVLINGQQVKLIGRVSMDMITVDLGDMPAKVGDKVILWGKDNPVERIAFAANTIAYELTCGILPRVERVIL